MTTLWTRFNSAVSLSNDAREDALGADAAADAALNIAQTVDVSSRRDRIEVPLYVSSHRAWRFSAGVGMNSKIANGEGSVSIVRCD